MKPVEINDSATIAAICLIQQRFAEAWNNAELNNGIGQVSALPGGAIYSGATHNAVFDLPCGTQVVIKSHRHWWHWHDGWSFCRNPITPADIRKVVILGATSMDSFNQWLAVAQLEAQL